MNHFVIDGMNLAHRAHNANFELRSADGRPTGMFFGFVRTVVSLKRKYRGYQFCVAWDNRSEKKIAIRPDYKAGRTMLPPTVIDELKDIRIFLSACGVDQYECKGQEADDVMATLVERWGCQDGHTVLYSNDKDLLQLVKDGKVVMYSPKVAQKPEKFYDESAVQERFGVPPRLLVCFRSLDGDPSDGLAGVSRVRRKLLAALVAEHEDLDGVYSSVRTASLSDHEKETMESFKDKAYENLSLMRLDRNVEGIVESAGSVDKVVMAGVLAKNDVKSVEPEAVGDLFMSSLNVKYGDPINTAKVETYSLF